ncbi:hypothetical protein FGIG_03029 [Fasciola gigantica]|uniref:Uncharacterized protein n=1 Tax=Fasciola gigantica TaxID=46835 RepID=A0A504YXF6_FASGI|nr:hypothetical protein FGIG_03029 [Fasciola gigantica]
MLLRHQSSPDISSNGPLYQKFPPEEKRKMVKLRKHARSLKLTNQCVWIDEYLIRRSIRQTTDLFEPFYRMEITLPSSASSLSRSSSESSSSSSSSSILPPCSEMQTGEPQRYQKFRNSFRLAQKSNGSKQNDNGIKENGKLSKRPDRENEFSRAERERRMQQIEDLAREKVSLFLCQSVLAHVTQKVIFTLVMKNQTKQNKTKLMQCDLVILCAMMNGSI